jgi:hypothetical protein
MKLAASERIENDPVLGRCRAFAGSRRRLVVWMATMAIGEVVLAWVVVLGASGFQPSLAHHRLQLAAWPLFVLLFLGGILLLWTTLADLLGPHYSELRIGELGFSWTKDGRRTDVMWRSVSAIDVASFFYRPKAVRVSLKPRSARDLLPDGSDSLLLRVHLMSLEAPQVQVLMTSALTWWRGSQRSHPSTDEGGPEPPASA